MGQLHGKRILKVKYTKYLPFLAVKAGLNNSLSYDENDNVEEEENTNSAKKSDKAYLP